MTSHTVDLSSGITENFFTNLAALAGHKLVVRKRLTEITLELLQNIQRHGVVSDQTMLNINKYESGYLIRAVNVIAQEHVLPLRQVIESINSLDHAQQKKQHTMLLRNVSRDKKSGAGLGLYRIAIRSASVLKASFEKINQHYFTFSLHVTLLA